MNNHPTDDFCHPTLHLGLVEALHARSLRFVEMDQLIFPDESEGAYLRAGPPTQSQVFIQILDADKCAVASGSYTHSLNPGRSPFIGPRAEPGSARMRLLDDLEATLSAQACNL